MKDDTFHPIDSVQASAGYVSCQETIICYKGLHVHILLYLSACLLKKFKHYCFIV